MSADQRRHGWYGTYTNHGCRCEACRAAWAAYRRASRPAPLLEPSHRQDCSVDKEG